MKRRVEDPPQLQAALAVLWRHYRAPLVKLLGGEPLLHPNLAEIVQVVRDTCGARVRVVTNGTLLLRSYPRLRGVDEIHISQYPDVPIPNDHDLAEIARDLQASITVESFDAFRWHRTAAPHDTLLTNRIFATCQLYHVWQCHTLRDGWFYPCPPAATWSASAEGANLLDPDITISDVLDALLTRQKPLKACSTCLGSAGALFPHHLGWRATGATSRPDTLDFPFLRQLEKNPDAPNECYRYLRTLHPSGEVELHSVT